MSSSTQLGDPTVRWVAYGAAAVEALRDAIVDAKRGDPLRRVTVVVPTKVSGLGLRRELSSRPGGSVGVGFLVAAQLAELLGASRVAASDLRPLTPAVRGEVVRAALRRRPGVLGHLASHPATARAVDDAFATLRQAAAGGGEDELLDALRGSGGLRATVADAYDEFRCLTMGTRYDEHDLARFAAEVAATDPELVRREVGPVVIHLPTRTDPATTRLVRTLAGVTDVTVLAGATGDAVADAHTAEVITMLAGGPVEVPEGAGPSSLPPVEAVVVPDAEEEVRQAARTVSGLLHDGGDPSRVAILYRASEPYATLTHEILAAAGLPHNGPTERTIRQTIAGRFLWDAWTWARDDHPRAGLFDLVGSVPVLHDGHRVPAEVWDRSARRARVLGGRDHWDRRLEGAAREAERQLAGGAADWLRERLERDRDRARELREFALAFVDALVPPQPLSWSGWSRWALHLLDTYLGRSRGGWPEVDAEAEGVLRQHLATLAQLDDLPDELGIDAAEVTADEARAAIGAVLDEPAGRVGRAGTGVYVGPLGTAGTLDVDHAIVLGAVEGQFPPTPRDRTLLPDAVLAALRAASPDGSPAAEAVAAIPDVTARVAAVRQALRRVVAGSGRVTFTVPRADRREQRARIPGPWLLELLGEQQGSRVTVSGLLEDTEHVVGARAVDSAIAGLRSTATAAGADEERLRVLSSRVAAGGDAAADPIVGAWPALAHGIEVTRLRGGDAFTAFDGLVTDADEVLRARLARPHAPSTLSDYSTCPRRYLFKVVLGVRAEDEPRRWLDVDALDRGNLVHDTLEQWVGETLPDGPRPPEGGADAGSEARLFELFEANVAELEASGRTGIPALWEIEKGRLRRRLARWLTDDRALREGEGVEPIAVELPFGMGDDAAALEVETATGVTLRMRGRVDRVDADDARTRVVVSDYKTSPPGRYQGLLDDIAQQGTELQLPIYGLAASRLHPDAEVQVGYWHVHDAVKKPEPTLVPFDDAARVRTQQVLDTIAAGVAGGVFPARPGGETLWPRPTFDNCRFCEFDRICPSHAERIRAAQRDLAADEVRVLDALVLPEDGDRATSGEGTA